MTGLNIPTKNLSLWITIVILLIAQIVTYTLLKDQVRRNTTELESHNLELIEHQIKEINGKVDKIDGKTEQIFTLVQEYLRDNQ